MHTRDHVGVRSVAPRDDVPAEVLKPPDEPLHAREPAPGPAGLLRGRALSDLGPPTPATVRHRHEERRRMDLRRSEPGELLDNRQRWDHVHASVGRAPGNLVRIALVARVEAERVLETPHPGRDGGERRRVSKVGRHRDADAIGLADDGLHERWRELLVDLQVVHAAPQRRRATWRASSAVATDTLMSRPCRGRGRGRRSMVRT